MLRSSEIKPLFVDLSLSDKSFLFISFWVRRFRHRYLSTTLSALTPPPKNVLRYNVIMVFIYYRRNFVVGKSAVSRVRVSHRHLVHDCKVVGFPTDISYTIIRRYGFPQKC